MYGPCGALPPGRYASGMYFLKPCSGQTPVSSISYQNAIPSWVGVVSSAVSDHGPTPAVFPPSTRYSYRVPGSSPMWE